MTRGLDVVLVAVGLAYPFLVYFGLQILPAGFFAIGLLVIIALRLAFSRGQNGHNTLPYLIAALVLMILAARSPIVGLKAYPVLLSLALVAVFGYSLVWPPTVVEQIARIRHPDLPLQVNSYLRKVTIAWLMFFLVNAALSATTAMSGSLKLWTLYNGFIAYIAMGVMFAVEFLIRQFVHQRIRRTA
jgi:uncharacterized membrane protein